MAGSDAVSQVEALTSDSANQLIRAVIADELRHSVEDNSRGMHEVVTDADGKQRSKRVVEMRDGSVELLLTVNGHPLNSQPGRSRRCTHWGGSISSSGDCDE